PAAAGAKPRRRGSGVCRASRITWLRRFSGLVLLATKLRCGGTNCLQPEFAGSRRDCRCQGRTSEPGKSDTRFQEKRSEITAANKAGENRGTEEAGARAEKNHQETHQASATGRDDLLHPSRRRASQSQ